MKKIFLILVFVLVLAANGWGATYYVDKRCEKNGNGTAVTCAASDGGVGAWNDVNDAQNQAKVPPGNTVLFVSGSGPYYSSDFTKGGLGYFTPNGLSGTTTFDLGGNTWQFDVQLVNSAIYQWQQSTAVGKETWWYCTLIGGGDPSLDDPKSVVVNGDWNDDSMNLDAGSNVSYKLNNWDFNDYDTLGFSTVYVKTVGNITPSSVFAAQKNTSGSADVVTIYNTAGSFVIKNGIIRGGTVHLINTDAAKLTLQNIKLYNAADQGVNINQAGAGLLVSYSKFIDCGHRGVYISNNADTDIELYNNDFEGVHLALLIDADNTYTVTFKNNKTLNMYAGVIQHDVATPTLVESNNVLHIDPDSTHNSKAIAFTTSTSQWSVTDSTDFPGSTATTNSVGEIPSRANLMDTGEEIVGVNDRDILDFYGKYPYGPVDIGLKQTWGIPKRGKVLFLGGHMLVNNIL